MVWFWKKKQEQEQQDEFSDLPPLPPLSEDSGAQMQSYDDRQMSSLPPLPDLPPLPSGGPMQTQMPQQQLSYPTMSSSQSAFRSTPVESAAVFVRLDKYKDIMHVIEQMQGRLDELQHSLAKISAIKQKETEIIQGWHALMSESKAKVDELNQKLLKPGET